MEGDFLSKIRMVGTSFLGIKILEKFINMDSFNTETIAIATHHLDYSHSSAKIKIDIGRGERFGLDGGSPQRSEKLAMRCHDEILEALDGSEIVLGITDLGDDDGEGIPPVIAEISKEIGALSIFLTFIPFGMVPHRQRKAQDFLEKIIDKSDNVIKIEMEYFFKIIPPKTPLMTAFNMIEHFIAEDLIYILKCYNKLKFINSSALML